MKFDERLKFIGKCFSRATFLSYFVNNLILKYGNHETKNF
jgi:hypothetical protein